MRILRPFRRSACFRHVRALSPPSLIGAASSKLMPAGMATIRALALIEMNSACAPNLSPLLPKTRSPTANSLTAAPTASTSPANSVPRTRCFGRRRPKTRRLIKERARPLRRLASRVAQSNRLTVVAWTLTRTSSSLGTGRSTSSSRRTSGGPYLSKTTALISFRVQDFRDVGARRPAPGNRGGGDRHDYTREWYRNQLPGCKNTVCGLRRVVAAEAGDQVEECSAERDACRYRDQTTDQRQEPGRGGDHPDHLARAHAKRLEGGGVAGALARGQQQGGEDAGDCDQRDHSRDREQDGADHSSRRGRTDLVGLDVKQVRLRRCQALHVGVDVRTGLEGDQVAGRREVRHCRRD